METLTDTSLLPGKLRPPRFPRERVTRWLVVTALMAMGITVRLINLTNPPFDYHPTRQLHSAMIARGMYYSRTPDAPEWRREMAIRQWQGREVVEPRILETIVAWGYLLAGGEQLWIARLLSSVFWVLGGIPLFLLARNLSSFWGGAVGLSFYLFLPFGVTASRSFQPDPLMVALLSLGIWALHRWAVAEAPTWRLTLCVGLIASLAPLVKAVAILPLLAGLAGMLLARPRPFRRVRDPRVWLLGVLTVLPAAGYYARAMFLTHEITAAGRFIPALLGQIRFYLDWQELAVRLVGYGAILAAGLGTLLLIGISRGLLLGLWAGFLIYGLLFPYHITTHDYYHLPLVPILALGMAPMAGQVADRLGAIPQTAAWRLARFLVVAALLGVAVRAARGVVAARDYRPEVGYWEYLGNLLEHRSDVIMLSHDYGYRLTYYGWVNGVAWPGQADLALGELLGEAPGMSEGEMVERLAGHSYFVTTLLGELEAQPELERYLAERFPVFERGEDFVIYDLRHPLSSGN